MINEINDRAALEFLRIPPREIRYALLSRDSFDWSFDSIYVNVEHPRDFFIIVINIQRVECAVIYAFVSLLSKKLYSREGSR